MKSILEDLFMGKIDIIETLSMHKRKPIPEGEIFTKTLSPEQQEMYERVINSFLDRWALDNQESFVMGFRMAVKMIVESLEDSNT